MPADNPQFYRRITTGLAAAVLTSAVLVEPLIRPVFAQSEPPIIPSAQVDKWPTFKIPDIMPARRINASEFQSEKIGLRDLNIFSSRELGITVIRLTTDLGVTTGVDPVQKPWFQPLDMPLVPAPTARRRDINHDLIPEEFEQGLLYEARHIGNEITPTVLTSMVPNPLPFVAHILWLPEGALIGKDGNPLPTTYLRARFIFEQTP